MKQILRNGLDILLVLFLAMALIAYFAPASEDTGSKSKGSSGPTFASDRADRADELDRIEEAVDDAGSSRDDDEDEESEDAEPSGDGSSGGGSITVEYGGLDVDSDDMTVGNKATIKDLGLFEEASRSVERQFRLDRDLVVVIGDVAEDNETAIANGPAYYPSENTIVFPWRWMRQTYDVLEKEVDTGEAAMEITAESLQFVLYHEFAHALIDQLDLAITGREEDAADQFATLLALQVKGNAKAAFATGLVFTAMEGEDDPSLQQYLDEHSFGKQRLAMSLCYMLGAAEVAGEEGSEDIRQFLGARAPRCASEYQQMQSAWVRILEPHTIDNGDQEGE